MVPHQQLKKHQRIDRQQKNGQLEIVGKTDIHDDIRGPLFPIVSHQRSVSLCSQQVRQVLELCGNLASEEDPPAPRRVSIFHRDHAFQASGCSQQVADFQRVPQTLAHPLYHGRGRFRPMLVRFRLFLVFIDIQGLYS